ncbi:MAG: FAD-dependent oxidoreductase [Chloroflexi bacterium]|nr:FAD-dependent oxidoreductase [Chloroflexota bacterium]
MAKTIRETAREIRIFSETEVVVVGGGPAGVAAAVAAARGGAKTILVERYGHLGGMSTGGLVILIPFLSDGTTSRQIAGLCQEMIDRLDAMGAAVHPKDEEVGSTDPKILNYWRRRGHGGFISGGAVRYGALVDPEMLKCVLNDMVEESGVKLLLHSWGSRAIAEDDKVQGMIFESKSGRQAILSQITIDTTGDGDMFASVGAEFDDTIDRSVRSSNLALVFRIANVDADKYADFRDKEKTRHDELMKELTSQGGFNTYWRSSRPDILWCNNWIPNLSALSVEDLTWVEVNARKSMLLSHKFLKQNVPGFENSFIMDTASQIGTRGSGRLIGEHVVTWQDVLSGVVHEDSIAVLPHLGQTVSKGFPHVYIPYRALLPRRIDNLLVAGRCFSSDVNANNSLNWIQQCIPTGQAAGAAAALAIKQGTIPRKIDRKSLQASLLKQGVTLPGVTIESRSVSPAQRTSVG